MRTKVVGYLCVAIVIVTSVTIAQSNSEADAWAQAQEKDTIEVYAEFYMNYPQTAHKSAIKKNVDRLIVAAVGREVRDNKAQVSLRGMGGSSVIPLSGVGLGTRMTVGGGVLNLTHDLIFLTDPTEPIIFTGHYDAPRQLYCAKFISGRGILIQHLPDSTTFVYVFGVDVSSVVANYYKWNTTPEDWGEKAPEPNIPAKQEAQPIKEPSPPDMEGSTVPAKSPPKKELVRLLLQMYLNNNLVVNDSDIEREIKNNPKLDRQQAIAIIQRTKTKDLLDQYFIELCAKLHVQKVGENLPTVGRIHKRLLNSPKQPRKDWWILTEQIKTDLTTEEKNLVLATFDGGAVTLEDWFDALCEISPPARPKEIDTVTGIDSVLDRALKIAVFVAEAKRLGIDKTEKPSSQSDFVIPDIEPSLSGYTNTGVIDGSKTGEIWVKPDSKANSRVVLVAKGGYWVASTDGKESSVTYVKQGARIRFDPAGTVIQPGLVELSNNSKISVAYENGIPNIGIPACDSKDWFIGSLDYDGSIYTLVGRVPICGYVFESSQDSPLKFQLVKGKGFVYLSGKGKVTGKDGKETDLTNLSDTKGKTTREPNVPKAEMLI